MRLWKMKEETRSKRLLWEISSERVPCHDERTSYDRDVYSATATLSSIFDTTSPLDMIPHQTKPIRRPTYEQASPNHEKTWTDMNQDNGEKDVGAGDQLSRGAQCHLGGKPVIESPTKAMKPDEPFSIMCLNPSTLVTRCSCVLSKRCCCCAA